MFRRLIPLLLVAALIVVAALAWLYDQLHAPLGAGSGAEMLVVEPGETLIGIAARLQAEGLIRHRLPLRLYVRLSGRSRIHAGEYRLVRGESALDLLARLERGDVIRYSITFPEGWTLAQWRAILARQSKLRQVAADWSGAELAQEMGIGQANPEGWFSPNTYYFVAGEPDLGILTRAHRRQVETLTGLWAERASGLPYREPYEALIMASLVEKETGVAAERARIAGVFVRRLALGMRLQTDPSVIYGLGDRYRGNLTRAHLREPNAYNTYHIDGLPPTPIANPGDDALRAALAPAEGEALYFVARGDGSHEFSATLREHQSAVRRYQLQPRADYRSSPKPEADAQ